MKRLLLAALLVAAPAFGSGPSTAEPVLHGDPAHPDAARWIRCELYFAIGSVESSDREARELRWRDFLDREVTPRFPDGLSVIEAYGQWRSRGAAQPGRDVSKVLVILCADTPENRQALDAVRSAYKALTHSKSVLLVTMPADVSF